MSDYERYLMTFDGGPHHGTRMTDTTKTSWPLWDFIALDGGTYLKVSESEPSEQDLENGILRSAKYRWQRNKDD